MLAFVAPLQAAESQRAVLLISIDGLHPSYVIEAQKHGMKVPVLQEFVKGGAYANSVVNVTPTVTYPNHTALVTGVAPAVHGVYTNTVFDPEGVEKGAWNAQPQLLTVHIVGLDSSQHANGPLPTNKGAREMLEQLDGLIGRMIAAERQAHPEATIAIVSDHGFLPVNATVNLNAALAKAGLIELTDPGLRWARRWSAR